jgi:ketosteroid isomerase-like protein
LEQGDRIRIDRSTTTRRRRTLDERVFVRFPALARLALAGGARLRPGSRLRRALVSRSLSQGYAAGNRRDFDVLLLGADPAIDYRAVSAGPGGGPAPDLVGHHYGHAGYLHVWRVMLDGFADLTLEPEEVLDLGDRLIATVRMRGHGSGSGVPFDQTLFQVFTLRRGLAVKQEDFAERAEALAAAGLDPEQRG